MKKIYLYSIAAFVLLFGVCGTGFAEDQRSMVIEAKEKKALLMQRAREEKTRAAQEASAARARILSDRTALADAISKIKAENQRIQAAITGLENELTSLKKEEATLREKVAEQQADTRELVGVIRANVKDLTTEMNLSLQNAFMPERTAGLKDLVNQTVFPEMRDVEGMCNVLFDEIQRSGEVRIEEASFINRAGTESRGPVLVLGNFTAAYQLPEETGFMLYSETSRRLFALSKLPPRRMAKALDSYMRGASVSAPIDISRGAALRQLTYRVSLWDRIQKGGPIVWPILIIGAVAVLIILERILYLFRKHVRSDSLMVKLCDHASKQEWQSCRDLCATKKNKPLPRILLAGIACHDMKRADLENALQEAILNEIPRLERFLSTLGMLAAIAPLLGLLGTVTGMINTFQIITLYGTGDPRLMSGGISEALVTTMLGLSVAIPIMLAHTLISRKVENTIAEMEEKAVALVNTVSKTRNSQ